MGYRWLARLAAVCLALLLCSGAALADGVTLKTVSTFAGTDAAADTYAELLKKWQEQSGNTVLDESATSDEAWKTGVLKDFAAGNEADVLFFFARTTDSEAILGKVVPIAEINAAYPDAALMESADIAEKDGVVYAIPVRPFWEGLFCNIDLFERHGVELPTTWQKLEQAIATFRDAGVVPISVSLSDVPHYIAEFCILASGGVAEHLARPSAGESVPQSWVDGMALIRRLYEMGAFSADVNATTEAAASQLFRDKRAAMQVDGSWFANSLSDEGMQTTVVLPFPVASDSADPGAYISGVSMGFYMSRYAWRDAARRDAAVDLLRFLTTGDNAKALGVYDISGELWRSYEAMAQGAPAHSRPIQDDMQPEARGLWFASIPGVADGSVDPAQMWREIMLTDPFGAD